VVETYPCKTFPTHQCSCLASLTTLGRESNATATLTDTASSVTSRHSSHFFCFSRSFENDPKRTPFFPILSSAEQRVLPILAVHYSGIPRNFVRGGGGSINSVEDREQRERGSGGVSPIVRGSGGSCNLVQEISFRIVTFS